MKICKLLNDFSEAYKRYCRENPTEGVLEAFHHGMETQYKSGTKLTNEMPTDNFYQFCGEVAFPDCPEMIAVCAQLLKRSFILGRRQEAGA